MGGEVDCQIGGWMDGRGDICRHGVYCLDNHNHISFVLTLSDVDFILHSYRQHTDQRSKQYRQEIGPLSA
jgi:hypothetical protein